jgi:cytochrome c oxidase cbb3-type subunit III
MTTSAFPRHESREQPVESAPASPDRPVMDHEYDGIREYDNPLPRWWVNLFWASFVFSFGYAFHYHLSGNGQSVMAAYQEEERSAQAEKSKQALAEAPSEGALATLMNDAELMKSAGAEFSKRCAPCHAAQGQGLIGPNLTDEYWLHGSGSLMDIYKVVSVGVAAKGMPAWQNQLAPAELRQLVAYVGTLRGKNVPGKPAQGERVNRP